MALSSSSVCVDSFSFFYRPEKWQTVGISAAVISQILIITVWQDAKFGTIANVIIIAVAVFSSGNFGFENLFRNEASELIKNTKPISGELLTEADLVNLPEPVRNYLKFTGVVNKPKIKNMRVVFEGEMRSRGKDYFSFRSEQFNSFEDPARLFFMKAKMFGITVPGYHRYVNGEASMDIRLFGLIPVVKNSGDIMNKTETVTLFNDLCLLAPAALTDKRIQWEKINDTAVKAVFTNKGISVLAELFFNSQGQLINFISGDRTDISDMKQYPFSTPVSEYRNTNGFDLISKGEAVWKYPDGDFTYGKFYLKEIQYNLQ
ncbi:MAG: hypothetical protein JSS91_07160 [Bacteroidetes bacterium]|nr:hypothetical protein [Bacteroidota bacterium]